MAGGHASEVVVTTRSGGYICNLMSPDAELMLIFGTLHLIAVALGVRCS